MNEKLYQAAALIVPLIIAIVFHEVAHGWTARLLGDPTAARLNRLSLNPLRHVDPIGTVVLPGILALVKAPIFGWAKPVPVNRMKLRNPRYGMMLVAVAGPGANLLLAAVSAILLGLTVQFGDEASSAVRFISDNLFNFLLINVFLAVFNMLPIPPFDGSHVVEGLLPRSLAVHWNRFGRFGLLLMIGLIIVLPWAIPGFNPVGDAMKQPVRWMLARYIELASLFAGG